MQEAPIFEARVDKFTSREYVLPTHSFGMENYGSRRVAAMIQQSPRAF